jgi:hypothetical protein
MKSHLVKLFYPLSPIKKNGAENGRVQDRDTKKQERKGEYKRDTDKRH